MPQVTVITATYNRSKLLGYAIQSVLRQTLSDFELLVVGDGCTDDSAEVVASFGDDRIRWHNLPENSGSQSAPNNYGLEHAQGTYVAYLGHDDLWYPTHLVNLARAMEEQQAVVAHSLCVRIGWEEVRALHGMPESYADLREPFVPPSAVMHRRDLVERIGPWRDYRELDVSPDRDFFTRARATGVRIAAVMELTCFKFPSVWRPESYRQDFSGEQDDYFRRMQDQPDFLYREMLDIARAYVLGKTTPVRDKDTYRPRVKHFGWSIERNRRLRGLEARPTPKPTLRHYREFLVRAVRGRLRRYLRFLRIGS